jgi:hypothetical protein
MEGGMTQPSRELPKRAKAKFTRLADAENEAADVLRGTVNRISDLNRVMLLRTGGDMQDEEAELARLEGLRAQQHRRHMELANGVTKIRKFLMQLPANVELEDAPREKTQPSKGESMLEAINRVQLEIREAQSDVRKLYLAGPRAADMKRAAKNYVAGLAATGRPTITATHEKFDLAFDGGGFTVAPNVRAILAWLDPDALLKRLEDEIDAMPVPELTLSLKEKNERLAAAKAKLLVLEREEEALIEAASDSGQHVVRRFDADPQAILGVQIKRRKAVAA